MELELEIVRFFLLQLVLLLWLLHGKFQNSMSIDKFCMLTASMFLPQEVEKIEVPAYSAINADYYRIPYGQGQLGETNSSLTVEQQHKFIIREISPEWGFAAETTKVSRLSSSTFKT